MRRAVFALLGSFMLVAFALSGGAAQAGNYGYGGGVVVGGGGYVGGGGVVVGGGGYYGPGWGGSRCCGCPRGLFTGCGAYYPSSPGYVVMPAERPVYVVPAERPVYNSGPPRDCPKLAVPDGRGGWVWSRNCY